MLVEARLRLTGPVTIGVPESRTVGRHHLVDQDDAPICRHAEFELGIRDDNSLVAADLFAERIDRAGHALERVGRFVAEDLAHARDRDVLVVAGFGLGCRAENRRIELAAFDKAALKLFARQRAMLGVFLPRRAREIAADHAFDRKYRGAPAQHRASGERATMPAQRGHFTDDLVGIGADHVMMDDAFELLEPPRADLGQYRAFHRNGLGHYHVKSADPVGGQEQQAVIADGIDIANLAAPDPWKGQVAGKHGGHGKTFGRRGVRASASGGKELLGQFTPAAE